MEYYLRAMTPADLDEVLAIETESFPTPWTRDAFARELKSNLFAVYLVCCCDGRIVGYGGMWLIIDEAHVTNIAVHPRHRRGGAGNLILGGLTAEAASRGATRMTLEVRPSNAAALKLYQAHGFVRAGLRHRYYSDTGEDAIIMWKHDLKGGGSLGDTGARDQLR